jgi:hypothetical protein
LDNKGLNGGVSRTPSGLCWTMWSSNVLIKVWTLNIYCSGLDLGQELDGCWTGVITSSHWTGSSPQASHQLLTYQPHHYQSTILLRMSFPIARTSYSSSVTSTSTIHGLAPSNPPAVCGRSNILHQRARQQEHVNEVSFSNRYTMSGETLLVNP